ncbi:MAG: hypothetical protein AAGH15_11520 [Myxococcota bacterium]
MAYTADDLVSAIRLRASLDSESEPTSTEILDLATSSLRTLCLSELRRAREEFLIYRYDQPLADEARFPIPGRAVGDGLRHVVPVDRDGHEGLPLPLLSLDQAQEHAASGLISWQARYGYVAEGPAIRLIPEPTEGPNGPTLRMRYMVRPGRLQTAVGEVTVASYAAGVVTASGAPTTFSSGDRVDIVAARPPFAYRAIDIPATVAGSTVTIDETDPGFQEAPQAGDYVVAADTVPLMPLPAEMWDLLVQDTVVRVLRHIGQLDEARAAAEERNGIRGDLRTIWEPRVGRNKKVVNRHSHLRTGRFRGYRGS